MKTQHENSLHLLRLKLDTYPLFLCRFLETNIGVLAPTTLLSYSTDLENFLEWLIAEGFSKAKQIKDIDVQVLNDLHRDDLEDYRNFLMGQLNKKGQPLSIRTINRKTAALKSLFNYLISTDDRYTRKPYIERNPMAQVKLLHDDYSEDSRKNNLETSILVEDEIQEFRDFIRSGYGELIENGDLNGHKKQQLKRWIDNRERDTAIASLILGSGLRIGEVADIDLSSLNLPEQTVYLRRKSGSMRNVPFSRIAAEDIKQYLNIRSQRYNCPDSEDALFLSLYRGSGKKMTKRAMQNAILKYAIQFGKPKVRAHKLRHSFGTNHIRTHNNIPLLQRILDHSSPETTMIYVNLFDSQIKESIDAADKKD
ncbi:tyrosine recombinase XerS [Bacillus swezeyi]|uniref:Tyrosine recombinase XerS n=1 Tax=Bacillus swezeyi TaxID=1925020 RepID=A0A5M8RGK1_9BACI|nr:tyrosine recombinase XerS [Bacillus swezeyi]KAA6446971.1 tyrosine recombinase XerS [Bacillus swezeyi]KAA6471539.1 tyrosine recombinase XerS [Bacillus swezeyi]